MNAQELYRRLDNAGLEYDVVEIGDGYRSINFTVSAFSEIESVRMRDDLAKEFLSIPASHAFRDYDHLVDPILYITAQELDGATIGDDPAHPDDHAFCFVQLKDGRGLYFMGVDLDFE